MKQPPRFVTIKIPAEARVELDKLIALASQTGWRSLGIERNDVPTLGAIVLEAIKRFRRAAP